MSDDKKDDHNKDKPEPRGGYPGDGTNWSSERDPGGNMPDKGYETGGHGGDHDTNAGGAFVTTGRYAPKQSGSAGVAAATALGLTLNMVSKEVIAGLFLKALETAYEVGKVSPVGVAISTVIYSLTPTKIATDDPNKMSRITMSLPVDQVGVSPGVLTDTTSTVQVTRRVVDIVDDGKQKLAVVTGLPMSVPVVNAKHKNKTSTFTVDVPGLPTVNINSQWKGVPDKSAIPDVTPSVGSVHKPSGFNLGEHTVDFIVRFPEVNGQNRPPAYISLTVPLTPEQVKRKQEFERTKQSIWDADHPWIAAQKEYDAAVADLNNFNADIDRTQQAYPGLVQEVARAQRRVDGSKKFHGWKNIDKKFVELYKKQLRTAINNETAARVKLEGAVEARKAKEKNVKDKKDNLDAANGKRKGVTDEGHSYHPAPSKLDGFKDAERGNDKTPRQGGGGKRRRWKTNKGREILEWDYQHGEIEKYRSSDGSHLGAFDPKTGKQIKPADPSRNIKKYL